MAQSHGAASNRPFDAVTLEILWRRIISAVDEAAKALRRTSFSTLVNESNDFACVLTDAAGQSLAQNTESIPSFIGTLPVTVKQFIREIGLDNMRAGDVLITNTPWIATGHLNDITVARPIFRDGRIVAFAASTAHAPDIGGKSVGDGKHHRRRSPAGAFSPCREARPCKTPITRAFLGQRPIHFQDIGKAKDRGRPYARKHQNIGSFI